MKRAKLQIDHVGDGRSKKTAIYFLNARHAWDEQEFEGLWLEANKIEFPKITDPKSEYFGSCEPDVNHEIIEENDATYVRYNTTKGDLWFKLDREEIKGIDNYLGWLEEMGY